VDVSDKPRTTFPLRLAASLRERAEKLSALDGVSMNQFINLAVAEKVSRLEAKMHHKTVLAKKVL
jgi:predicted HicB family RNase H-like nuclease